MRAFAALLASLLLGGLLAPAQAQSPATLVGTWAISRAETGTGPGGVAYDHLRWVRRHAADGSGSVEVRFYFEGKPVLTHKEEGTWGLAKGTYWFHCARVLREGAMTACDRRAEYALLGIDPATFRYRAAGSELLHVLARVPEDYQLP